MVDLDAPTPADIAKEFRGYRDPDGPTHNELRRNEMKKEVIEKIIFTPIQSCIYLLSSSLEYLLSSSLEQQEAGRSRD